MQGVLDPNNFNNAITEVLFNKIFVIFIIVIFWVAGVTVCSFWKDIMWVLNNLISPQIVNSPTPIIDI